MTVSTALTETPDPNSMERSLTIAVIGDVHDQWDDQDEQALQHLGVDLVLLVGDFGNESVDVVRSVAAMSLPKAVVLGNHDAWYSATHWGRDKCPYDRTAEDWVQDQLDALGVAHVGYGKLDLPELGLSVVGGRPFSWGGPQWRNKTFYRERYGLENFADSVNVIMDNVQQTTQDTVIFIGHCGPTGLGDRPEDPCGRDWEPRGGDFGDPDLTEAIAQTKALGKSVPLVTFGHMHHRLRHRKDCLRKRLVADDQTVYLNAADVPRIVPTEFGVKRNCSLVTLTGGKVTQAAIAWVDHQFQLCDEEILYQAPAAIAES